MLYEVITYLAQLDLSKLTMYDKWFAQYYQTPFFPYDFQIWQYTESGTVDGIDGSVDLNICFKDYSVITSYSIHYTKLYEVLFAHFVPFTVGEPLPRNDQLPDIASRLLAWYAREGRELPWRGTRDPYRISYNFV